MTATVSERNESSISRKAKTTTNTKTGTTEPMSWSLKSLLPATCPVTGACTPSTLPSVAGRTSSRSFSRLSVARSMSEPPTSGTDTRATSWASYSLTSTGPREAPEATACFLKSASACRTSGASMSLALTTTSAGSLPPGKASLMRLYVCTIGSESPNSWSRVSCWVFMPSAGAATAKSAPAATTTETSGLASTPRSTAVQNRLSPFPRRLRRPRNGSRPFSTRSPSSDSSAGSTVTEPTMATATTISEARPIASNSASPVNSMPAIATHTVTPETMIARPLVAAAIRRAVPASRPASRSSRSRRR